MGTKKEKRKERKVKKEKVKKGGKGRGRSEGHRDDTGPGATSL